MSCTRMETCNKVATLLAIGITIIAASPVPYESKSSADYSDPNLGRDAYYDDGYGQGYGPEHGYGDGKVEGKFFGPLKQPFEQFIAAKKIFKEQMKCSMMAMIGLGKHCATFVGPGVVPPPGIAPFGGLFQGFSGPGSFSQGSGYGGGPYSQGNGYGGGPFSQGNGFGGGYQSPGLQYQGSPYG